MKTTLTTLALLFWATSALATSHEAQEAPATPPQLLLLPGQTPPQMSIAPEENLGDYCDHVAEEPPAAV